MEFGNVYEVFELGDLVKINNDECLGKLCPCHVTEEAAKIQDKEKNNGNT